MVLRAIPISRTVDSGVDYHLEHVDKQDCRHSHLCMQAKFQQLMEEIYEAAVGSYLAQLPLNLELHNTAN